jgi:hypothetical protein
VDKVVTVEVVVQEVLRMEQGVAQLRAVWGVTMLMQVMDNPEPVMVVLQVGPVDKVPLDRQVQQVLQDNPDLVVWVPVGQVVEAVIQVEHLQCGQMEVPVEMEVPQVVEQGEQFAKVRVQVEMAELAEMEGMVLSVLPEITDKMVLKVEMLPL